MKTLLSILPVFMLSALTAFGQPTAAPTTAAASLAVTGLPVMFSFIGASFNTTVKPNYVSGLTSVAVQVGASSSRLYSITSMDFTRSNSSLRTGMGYALLQSKGFTFMTYTDGGVTTTSTSALGSLSGGGFLSYRVQSHFSVVGGVRMVSITSVVAKPVYVLGFSYQ